MRRLSRGQLRIRLVAFGGLSVGFMIVVGIAERVVSTATGPTAWTLVAAILGVSSIASLVRWRDAPTLEQEAWQPALLQRVLAGALGFQAGLLGYFLVGDLAAAALGCSLFLAGLVLAGRLLGLLVFEQAGA